GVAHHTSEQARAVHIASVVTLEHATGLAWGGRRPVSQPWQQVVRVSHPGSSSSGVGAVRISLLHLTAAWPAARRPGTDVDALADVVHTTDHPPRLSSRTISPAARSPAEVADDPAHGGANTANAIAGGLAGQFGPEPLPLAGPNLVGA